MLDLSLVQVVYEDNHLIAVNKPAGFLVQGDKTGDTPLSEYVKAYIKVRYKKPGDVFLGVIHRLDRPVSGTIIYARTSKGLSRMTELFRERKIEKNYWAITKQRPKPIVGKLEHYLIKDKSKNLAKAYPKRGNRTKDAKHSVLTYELISAIEAHYLIHVKPETGRPHQIRVQLATNGTPIIGDVKYGFSNPNDDGSILLHCRSMSFIHPIKQIPVTIESNPPDKFMWNRFKQSVDF